MKIIQEHWLINDHNLNMIQNEAILEKEETKQDFPFLWNQQTIAQYKASKIMFILRGPSGSGKSTLANTIVSEYQSAVVCSADDYFIKDGDYTFDSEELSSAHGCCKDKALTACQNSAPVVIIDNTNIRRWEMNFYFQIANQNNYFVNIVEPCTAWKFNAAELAKRTSHDVTEDVIERKIAMYQAAFPLYYGWFLNETESERLASTGTEIFKNFLLVPELLRLFAAAVKTEGMHGGGSNFQDYFKRKHFKTSVDILHCTAMFARRGKEPGVFEYASKPEVQVAMGTICELSVVGFFISPRSFGVRLRLNENQLVLWDKDDDEPRPVTSCKQLIRKSEGCHGRSSLDNKTVEGKQAMAGKADFQPATEPDERLLHNHDASAVSSSPEKTTCVGWQFDDVDGDSPGRFNPVDSVDSCERRDKVSCRELGKRPDLAEVKDCHLERGLQNTKAPEPLHMEITDWWDNDGSTTVQTSAVEDDVRLSEQIVAVVHDPESSSNELLDHAPDSVAEMDGIFLGGLYDLRDNEDLDDISELSLCHSDIRSQTDKLDVFDTGSIYDKNNDLTANDSPRNPPELNNLMQKKSDALKEDEITLKLLATCCIQEDNVQDLTDEPGDEGSHQNTESFKKCGDNNSMANVDHEDLASCCPVLTGHGRIEHGNENVSLCNVNNSGDQAGDGVASLPPHSLSMPETIGDCNCHSRSEDSNECKRPKANNNVLRLESNVAEETSSSTTLPGRGGTDTAGYGHDKSCQFDCGPNKKPFCVFEESGKPVSVVDTEKERHANIAKMTEHLPPSSETEEKLSEQALTLNQDRQDGVTIQQPVNDGTGLRSTDSAPSGGQKKGRKRRNKGRAAKGASSMTKDGQSLEDFDKQLQEVLRELDAEAKQGKKKGRKKNKSSKRKLLGPLPNTSSQQHVFDGELMPVEGAQCRVKDSTNCDLPVLPVEADKKELGLILHPKNLHVKKMPSEKCVDTSKAEGVSEESRKIGTGLGNSAGINEEMEDRTACFSDVNFDALNDQIFQASHICQNDIFHPCQGRGSRAHITLGCADSLKPVEAGFDLVDLVHLEATGGGEVDEIFKLPLEGIYVKSYDKGLFGIYLEKEIKIKALFGGYY